MVPAHVSTPIGDGQWIVATPLSEMIKTEGVEANVGEYRWPGYSVGFVEPVIWKVQRLQ